MKTLQERVHDGAAYLDDYGPLGWREMINLDRLKINSLTDCVLGQVYGEFFTWVTTRVHIDAFEHEDWVGDHGFNHYTGELPYDGELSALDYEWKEYLSA